MNGRISVVRYPIVTNYKNPLMGEWTYQDGIMRRGLIRKEVLDLRNLLQEVAISPEAIQLLVAEQAAGSAYYRTGAFTGANVVAGAVASSRTKKRISDSVVFDANLRDGRHFLGVSSQAVYDEIRSFDGVTEGFHEE